MRLQYLLVEDLDKEIGKEVEGEDVLGDSELLLEETQIRAIVRAPR